MQTVESTATGTALFARLFQNAHSWVDGTVATLTSEQAASMPPGLTLPAGAQFAHLVLSEDFLVSGAIQGGAPLAMSSWQGRTGISEPMMPFGLWDEWARSVQVDMPAARDYAQAVFAATDAYLATASDADLAGEVDLSAFGLGMQSVEYLLNNLVINAAAHCGEISALKGLHGAKGYPF